jgi:hypothetical protein
MKRQARAGARASAYEVARAMARTSCCFVMCERPGIFRRFAWLYSCSFVRLLRLVPPDVLRPLELLPDELRLVELLPERNLLPEPDDLDPLREDREPERLFDPEALLRPERLDPPLERELRALDPRCER